MLKLLLRYTLPQIWVLLLVMPLGSVLAKSPSSEMVAGSPIPIPAEMKKSTDRGMELMVPGFRGAQVVYKGKVTPQEVIRFYQENMPLKGWHPYASLVTGGGLLVFTKSHESVLIMVSESSGSTTLAILVGVMPPER